MTPDRMVVAEAMRTFTYLSLYGYLTDAVIVNRDLPRRARRDLLRRLARAPAGASSSACATASRRCRCCRRRTSRPRWPARRCSTGSAARCSAATTRPRCCTAGWRSEFGLGDGDGHVRLAVPFADKRRRVGQEDRRRAGRARSTGSQRTVILPAALAGAAAGRRGARRRRAGGALCLSPRTCAPCASTSTRRTPPPTGSCARRSARPRRPRAPAASDVPPRGWETPARRARPSAPDLAALLGLMDSVRQPCRRSSRASSPPCASCCSPLRALIDWYIERLEPAPGPAGADVEDIPID